MEENKLFHNVASELSSFRAIALWCICILMMLTLIFLSCKRKEQEPSGQVSNPYTTESVYGEIKKKIQENPNDPDLWYHLADLHERNAQYREEIEALKRVVELRPDKGYAYLKMGTAYNQLGQHKEAVDAFKKAIRYMPDYAVAYNNLAIAYGKLGLVDDEIASLKKAIKLRPQYAIARYNLGMAYLKKGNKREALQEYNKLKDIDQGIADALIKEIDAEGQRAKGHPKRGL